MSRCWKPLLRSFWIAVVVSAVQLAVVVVAERLVADVDDDVVLLADQRALDADPVVDGLVEGVGAALSSPYPVVSCTSSTQISWFCLHSATTLATSVAPFAVHRPPLSTTRTVLAPSALMSANEPVWSAIPGVRVVDARA